MKLTHCFNSSLLLFLRMDGALPSVVGGLVSCPVIAVPTR